MEPSGWRWAIEMCGNAFDLEHAEKFLRPAFAPRTFRLGPPHSALVLISSTLDEQNDADAVRSAGLRLISCLNGAARLRGNSLPITLGRVFSQDQTGISSHSLLAPAPIVHRSSVSEGTLEAFDADGNAIPAPPAAPSLEQNVLALAEGDSRVGDFLHFLGRADNWFDLYKAHEVLREIAGGEAALKTALGSSDWKNYENAKQEANFHRHARGASIPARRLSLGEARSAIERAGVMILSGLQPAPF